MRKTLVFVVLALLCVAPAFAQGPFNDVPTDHWAYDAVNTLQKDGIVIGYPDGTFGGKRAMSRYEFAVAIARLMPLLGTTPASTPGVTNEQLQNALKPYALKSEIPNVANFCTKADCDAIRKLVDEFRDELAALGVDVDALKRDVCALTARVEALEAEVNRVRFTGDVNVFGIATNHRGGLTNAVDLDEREITTTQTLGRTVAVVRDFDLNVTGRVNQSTTAFATINYGNYLNYVRFVDDYIDGTRPTTKTDVQAGNAFTDTFFPYYLYINAGLGKGALTVGRLPLQFTPYTLKKIDVDSYTTILKTDSGNYPVDGAKLGYNFGGVDVTLFAAKHDLNDFLVNGLTGQPNAGLFDTNGLVKAGYVFPTVAGLAGDHAAGLLDFPITQSAGARVQFGTPWKGTLGGTFYQAWSQGAFNAGSNYDQFRVYGGDLNIPIWVLGFTGSWTKSDTLAASGAAVGDITDDNQAWDAALTGNVGKFGFAAGYKNIDRNFAAAGFWDKIGRWTNPVDVKGPYANFTYPLSCGVKIVLNGEYLKMIDTVNANPAIFGTADDKIIKAEGGIKWGISKANSLDLGYQWIQFQPRATAGLDEAIESYLTIGWAHQMNANTGFKIGYQFINYDDGATKSGPYVNDYRGGLGVVQFGVSF